MVRISRKKTWFLTVLLFSHHLFCLFVVVVVVIVVKNYFDFYRSSSTLHITVDISKVSTWASLLTMQTPH